MLSETTELYSKKKEIKWCKQQLTTNEAVCWFETVPRMRLQKLWSGPRDEDARWLEDDDDAPPTLSPFQTKQHH